MSAPPFETAGALMLPGVSHGFFGRRGGVSTGVYESLNAGQGSKDDPAHVAENRARIAGSIGLSGAGALHSVYQVHGRECVVMRGPHAGERPQADAMVTDRPGVGLCILTADCGPVLLADAEAGVVGAAHAGWRGAVAGVTDSVIEAMERLGAVRERIVAALGPCIGLPSYEVGEDFRSAVLKETPWAEHHFHDRFGDKPHFDLKGYIAERLRLAGVSSTEILSGDTYADRERYHSHRRNSHEGMGDYGRNAAVILFLENSA